MNKRKQAKGGEKKVQRSHGNHFPARIVEIAATTVAGTEKVLSQRSLLLRSPRSLESSFPMIATIAAMAELFFFSAIAAIKAIVAIIYMETRLKEV